MGGVTDGREGSSWTTDGPRFGRVVAQHPALINDCKNLAMSRLHERHQLLIVRLKFLVAKHPRRRSFKGPDTRHRQFQDERVVASREIREKTCRRVGCKPLLNCEAFLHHSKSLTSLPELQVEHVADDDHEKPLFYGGRVPATCVSGRGGARVNTIGGATLCRPRQVSSGNHESPVKSTPVRGSGFAGPPSAPRPCC